MSVETKKKPAAPKKTKKKTTARQTSAEKTLKKNLDETLVLVEEITRKNLELEDKYIRMRAEFDNYRRRKSSEILKLMEYEGEGIFRALLPIIDDLERMESAVESNENQDESALKGFEMIIAKFRKVLSERGVEPFQSVGEVVDAALHDAMMVMNDESKKDGEILQEHEKGYKYKEKVLRHAKVVVNKL